MSPEMKEFLTLVQRSEALKLIVTIVLFLLVYGGAVWLLLSMT